MPKLSVIIPVYNAEEYLEQCVQCVLNQTLQDFEIILVNDGSTDNSGAICDSFAEKDSRIRVIHKENEGAGPTRTRGMLEAKGEYLAFPDSDDWFEPNMYEDLYNLAKSNNADIAYSSAYGVSFDEYGNETSRRLIPCKEVCFNTKEECRNGVMELFPTTTIFDVPWNKLYRRQVVLDNNIEFRKLRRCQDAVFNLDFYNCCERVASTSKAYYYYRENTQSLVWKKFPKDYIDIQIFYHKHIKELMTEWGVYSGDVSRHYDNSFVIAVYSVLSFCFNPNWKYTRKEKCDYVKDILSRDYIQAEFANIKSNVDDEHIPFIEKTLEKKYSDIFSRISKEHYISEFKKNLFKKLPSLYRIMAKIRHGAMNNGESGE